MSKKLLAIGFNADIPVSLMVQYAGLAEDHGFDSFWLHEHSFSRDALSFLNAAANKTSRIRLGVACLSPYTRFPVVLAMSMLTLQETSQGRAILGIGTGFPARLDLMGINHEKPIAALKETISICKKLWNGEVVSFQGKVFSLKNVASLAGKPNPIVPIYIAGWKKQMLALTGKYADGYVAKGGESPQSLSRITREIQEAAEKNGRKLDDIEICAYLLTLVANSKSEALNIARKDPFVNYMLSVQDDYLYEETGINPELKRPIAENYFKGKIAESSSHVTDEMLEAFTLCGSTDEILDRVKKYRDSNLSLPILQPISMKRSDVELVMNAASVSD